MNRALAGAKAQSFGTLFEQTFESHCLRNGIACSRIPDGCKVIGWNPKTKLKKIIQVKSPWDWVITYGPRTALLDTKTFEGRAFPNSAINENQVREMLKHKSSVNGYICWAREDDEVFFIPAGLLASAFQARGSISPRMQGTRWLGKIGNFDITSIFADEIGKVVGSA